MHKLYVDVSHVLHLQYRRLRLTIEKNDKHREERGHDECAPQRRGDSSIYLGTRPGASPRYRGADRPDLWDISPGRPSPPPQSSAAATAVCLRHHTEALYTAPACPLDAYVYPERQRGGRSHLAT